MKYLILLLMLFPLLASSYDNAYSAYGDAFYFTCLISSHNKKVTAPGKLTKTPQLASLSQTELENKAAGLFGQYMCSYVGQPVQAAYINPIGIRGGNIKVSEIQQFQAPNCTLVCKLTNPP